MFCWSASVFRNHFCHFFDKGFFLFTASSFDHFNMHKWHGCYTHRFELVYIVALWFYSTPKWEGVLARASHPVELGSNHTLWSRVRLRRNGVRFPKRTHDSFRVLCVVRVHRHIYTQPLRRSGLLTFFSSLVIQECLINFARNHSQCE